MEANKIEQLDERRFKNGNLFILGYVIWQGFDILSQLMMDYKSLMHGLSLLGWLFWTAALIRTVQFTSELKKNADLKEALNNEYYLLLRLKSFRVGFLVLIVLLYGFLLFSDYIPFTTMQVCQISAVAGIASVLIASSVFYKREN